MAVVSANHASHSGHSVVRDRLVTRFLHGESLNNFPSKGQRVPELLRTADRESKQTDWQAEHGHISSKSGYQMLQVMRFAVEEINNSTTLLPNVSLGYEIFDHCSNIKNLNSVLNLISKNGSIKPKEKLNNYQPKVIALTGPYGSTRTIATAPLITMDLIPMVNYGATSYALSNKLKYPSFVRTIPSNKDLVEMIIHIIQWFGWNWVAFIGSQDDYSTDGLKLFNKYINNTGICLAYQEGLSLNANYSQTLKKIDKLNINVIVVFALPQYASKIIKAAIANNIQDKVWIASQAWAMNQQIPREPGIRKIGTVIGITERLLSLPGFNKFIYKTRGTTVVGHNDSDETGILGKRNTCNQVCEYCSLLQVEEIIKENPTFSFAIYSAIYTIAHALHRVLQCDMNECHNKTMAKPYMVLEEIMPHDQSKNACFYILPYHRRFLRLRRLRLETHHILVLYPLGLDAMIQVWPVLLNDLFPGVLLSMGNFCQEVSFFLGVASEELPFSQLRLLRPSFNPELPLQGNYTPSYMLPPWCTEAEVYGQGNLSYVVGQDATP
ncbi:LOW QUALITY PROTEIN: taste receptor type 1 member 1-like [Puntigrus tetrazona]|uniref:LOW QUALITY PROTEIN: taste receptor type 1 member 1-like n=1 Tax=Puntigrus tetrazona TaxID=1606681 RepID=UPI001C88E376|nr:LOW QUALITY PROTEIN: taste receptor type 1 member 1-like [Puntigrus tetrazona]